MSDVSQTKIAVWIRISYCDFTLSKQKKHRKILVRHFVSKLCSKKYNHFLEHRDSCCIHL